MALRGCILGDILGSIYEFGKPDDFNYKTVNLCDKEMTFSDDTVLALAVKQATLTDKDYAKHFVEFGRKYESVGYGSSFYNWLMSEAHRPYNSYGNGSAMRVAFIADYYTSLVKVQKEAANSALVTHNHPEGIKGAIVTATCIWMAKNGLTKEGIYNFVEEQYPKDKYVFPISMSLEELRGKYMWSETCQNCVPVAMRCVYESNDYESFIRNVISLNCDADTIAAIGGGVAEELFGGFGNVKADEIIKYCLDDFLLSVLNKEV